MPFDNLVHMKAAQFTQQPVNNYNANMLNQFGQSNYNNPYLVAPHSIARPPSNPYYNDEKFFDNFLNQMNQQAANGKDSSDKSFYKYYAKENDKRKREGWHSI